MNSKNQYKELGKSLDRTYSKKATVLQTYSVKDQKELFNQGEELVLYDAYKHLTCDVRLLDGTEIYDVLLSPHVLAVDQNGNVTEIIYDGSAESPTGDIPVQIPLIGSYVIISFLNKSSAFVAQQTNSQNVIVGSSQGAYLDFFIQEDTRILDLKNADEFNIDFNNGYVFSIKTDNITNLTKWIALLETIILSIPGAEIYMGKDVNDNPVIKLSVENGGKISMKNNLENILDLETDFGQFFLDYINATYIGNTTANPALIPIIDNLKIKLNNWINTRVSNLFQ